MPGPPKAYADLHNLTEDERITMIGEHVTRTKDVAGVLVDDHPPEKAKRYVKKIMQRYPGVRILDVTPGPTKGVITIRVGPVDASLN